MGKYRIFQHLNDEYYNFNPGKHEMMGSLKTSFIYGHRTQLCNARQSKFPIIQRDIMDLIELIE